MQSCIKCNRRRPDCRCISPQITAGQKCLSCGAPATIEDELDSRLIGTLPRCRSCILSVAPEMLTAEQIAYGRAA